MKTWMLLAAAALTSLSASAQSLPADERVRAELIREIEASRTALLPQAQPLPPVTVKHQPRLEQVKAQTVAAKSPAELVKVGQEFRDWKAQVIRELYADNHRAVRGGESFTAYNERRVGEINFVMALRQQLTAQRFGDEAGSIRAASASPDATAAWSHLFDNRTPLSFGTASSPVSDGAVKVVPLAGAARYKKLRDIAVRSWGANPSIVDAAINEAMKQNVDPALVLSVIWQESRFNPHATSSCGARGLMQVMPDTGRGMGYSADRLYNVHDSLEAGIKYLRNAASYLKLNVDLSNIASVAPNKIKALLASYNAGCGAVSKWLRQQGADLVRIPYAETRHYVRIIADKIASLGDA